MSGLDTRVDDSAATTQSARDEFAVAGALVLPGVLEPGFAAVLGNIVARATFTASPAEGVGARALEVPDRAGAALCLALFRPALLAWLHAVTDRGPFGDITGAVAQLTVSSGHELGWHDDRKDDRRLAFTINLSDRPFVGGELEIRDRGSRTVVFRHRHRESGTAVIFDVAADREHRVRPIRSGGPRTVFSGWLLGSASAS